MPSCEINLLKAAIHPINFCTSWRLSGSFILVIADNFSGLGSIPWQETIYPSSFPESTPNVHFLGFNFILNFSHVVEGLFQVRDKSLIFLSLYDHVDNVHFSIVPNLWMQTLLYTPLVSCTCAFKSEGHSCITKCTKSSNEGCLNLVFYVEGNLMIPGIVVKET
jgi:hypothetical protein